MDTRSAKECPAIAAYVACEGAVPQAHLTYDELLQKGRIERPDWTHLDENEIAELFYTSGSTGTPKGVSLAHRTLYLHALNILASSAWTDTDTDLHTIPLFHVRQRMGSRADSNNEGAEAGDGAAL